MSLGQFLGCIIAGMVLAGAVSAVTGSNGVGLVIALIVSASGVWYLRQKPIRAEQQAAEEKQRRDDAERAAEAARQQEAADARKKREGELAAEQARLDDESLARRLRTAVSDLIASANMLQPNGDNSDVVQAMHDTASEMASWHRSLKPHHFGDKLLQHDSQVVLKLLERAGLKDDLLADRLRMVLRLEEPSSAPAATTGEELPPDVVRLHQRARSAS